jgi:hypothetical protein
MAFNFGGVKREENYQDSNNYHYPSFSNLPANSYDGNPYIDFTEEKEKNLIKLQIDMNESLDETSHWLNGDTPSMDKNGKKFWVTNTDEERRILNPVGISKVMRILNNYLSKDNILSNLTEEEIKKISSQIAFEINDLFFTSYDIMGLDTIDKKKNVPSIVIMICHRIYIVLMRAKDGLERESITQNAVVKQSDTSLGNYNQERGGILSHIPGFRRR